MYDVKSYYNQAKNVVLNIPEMEAKVREATNDDAWGASSTLMQDIAQGTHNYQSFNEIMPTIYSRFMEKEAREWRQIYKALTLLEYLIKHGSERVVDDARAHISTIKMLRNFHYIDEKGKDQGINVRNRANELASLLTDVDKIRAERRKARANRNKYQGVEGGMFNTASGSRYGGFGSDSVGGSGGGSGSGSGGRYGGHGGGGEDEYRARTSSGFQDTQGRQSYDEYEGADDFDDRPPRTSSRGAAPPRAQPKAAAAKQPEAPAKVANLLDFDDDDEPVAAAAVTATATATASAPDAFGDDDFDDFQSAPVGANPPAAAAASPAAGANANLFALLDGSKPAAKPAPMASPQPPMGSMMGGNPGGMGSMMNSASPASPPAQSPPAKKPASAFDDLFSASLGAPQPKATGTKTIAEMEKEKAMHGLWGAPQAAAQPQPAQATASKPAASGFDDLLL